ncbi:SAP domain-containing protein [Ihubacter massiliensis]|uniref:SAP domain-containing protein n=1 Tax=Anaerovoracaceae TaxID=543314 RepID=UPI0011DD28CB|nr:MULTISPECIES: SAP domain-containing protein [Eubacteriales Family XIII. Incertae Sedis]MCI7302537.1 SAP domain-containing protein [Clostridia bacterium]MCO7124129.1 SAP domain-containing protein [Ihubacter massiliensis]MDY3011417.1 SAP domain-containing protein [Clostridiales Family XIII bacterium]
MKFFGRKKEKKSTATLLNRPINDLDAEQLSSFHKEASDKAYAHYQNTVNNISPHNMDISDYDRSPLSSTEIFFLDYLDGLPIINPIIAQYWYYDYGLDYQTAIKKFIGQELLEVSCASLKKMKVPELKEILKEYKLPVSGKKSELCSRITNSISPEQLNKSLKDKGEFYQVTQKGNDLIKTVTPSATKNIELENKCIELISNRLYNDAYLLVADFKRGKPGNSGLGIDWNHEYNAGLSEHSIAQYNQIVEHSSFNYTLTKDREIERPIRASIVFCQMMGLGQRDIWKIIKRIYLEAGKSFDEDAQNIIKGRLL